MEFTGSRGYGWAALGVLLALAMLFVCVAARKSVTGESAGLSFDGGDTREYVSYAENLRLKGSYESDDGASFSRMPAYPLTYLAFELVFGSRAKSALAVFQSVLHGVSTYLLALAAFYAFRREAIFYLTFFLYGTSFLVSIWDVYILTESLALSSFVIAACLLFTYGERGGRRWLAAAGVAFAYCVACRPFMVVVFAPAVALVYWAARARLSASRAGAAAAVLLFLLPFAALEVGWVARNYRLTGRFIPLQESAYAGIGRSESATPYVAVWAWINAVGESAIAWEPNSLGAYMLNNCEESDPDFARCRRMTPESFAYPPYVLADSYGAQDLERGRLLYKRYASEKDPAAKRALADEVISTFGKFTRDYARERPAQYRLWSRWRVFRHAFLHSGPVLPLAPYPEILHRPPQLAIKLFSVASYYFALVAGALGLALALLRDRSPAALFLASVPALLFASLNLYLRYTEFRLYALMFPSLYVFGAYTLYRLLSLARARRPSPRGSLAEPAV